MKLASYLARAVDTRFFHDPDNIPVFAIRGPAACGKSLFVESMTKTWMHHHTLRDAVTIPHDNKMFLESKFCQAACLPLSVDTVAGGKTARFAFSSEFLYNGYEVRRFRDCAFGNSKLGGALLVSNDDPVEESSYKPNYLMIVEFQGFTSPTDYNRYARISIESDALHQDPRFMIYMDHLQEFRTRAGIGHIVEPGTETAALQPTPALALQA